MSSLPARIGQYEVLASIGAGGMGEVYRARDTRLGREVALKVLPEAFAGDPERLARFEREAKTLASLNHPHIAQIHGFEQHHAMSALVMELVEGEDLSDRIRRGPIPLEEALPIAHQIVEALEAAHDHGVIHRDLKPANIKVRADGTVKVLDFGLAKAIEGSGGAGGAGSAGGAELLNSPTITTPAMTARGVILGTAAYMSPEQAKGKPVDRRADIWAFGCVFYEMLTGRRPFAGEDVSETLAAVLKEQPAWTLLPADTPAPVRRLLERCLQKDPRKRLPHIGTARLELDEPVETPIATAVRRTSATPWIAASVVLAIALAVAAWPRQRAGAPPPASPLHLSLEIGAEVSLPNTIGASAVLSPDGNTLVFAAGNPESRLYVRPLERLEATMLPGTEGAGEPFFSPDGQWIGFFAGGKLKKVALAGGAAVELTNVTRGHGGWWGDDDHIVYSSTFASGPLMRIAARGGQPQRLVETTQHEIRVQHWPQVLPGAKTVLFTASPQINSFGGGNIAVQPLAGGEPKIVHRGGYYGRFVPSGHLVYLSGGTLFAVPFDLERLETIGTPKPVLSNIVGNPDNGSGQVAFSTTGALVAMAGQELTAAQPIMWTDRAGPAKPLLSKPIDWGNINFSPDGGRLAANIRDGSAAAWVYDMARDTLSRLTAMPGMNDYPIWSADGRRLTFGANESGDPGMPNNLYWQRADGSGSVQRLTTSPNPQRAGAWHPSGKALAFHEIKPKTQNDIMILPMDGDEQSGWKPGTPTPFAEEPFAEVDPVFSRDGKWLAYWALSPGGFQVYVRPFPGPGGKWQVSSGGGTSPSWSRSRDELFYLGEGNEIMVVSYRSVDGEFRADRPRPWSGARVVPRGAGQRSYALHPDGDRVAGLFASATDEARRDKVMMVLNFFDRLRRVAPAR